MSYKLYKIVVSPYLSFSYPIQSDTLFGAFCWSYKYIYGDEELEKFLQICMEDKPPIIFSNMFLNDKLPIPLAAINSVIKKGYNNIEEYKKIKKLNNKRLIHKKIFLEIANNNYSNILKYAENAYISTITQVHNMIDRESGTVTRDDDGGGNLFTIKESFALDTEKKFDIYMLCDDIKKYTDVLKLMFRLGIGNKKSTGKGGFKIEGFYNSDSLISSVKNPNAFVAISNFIPSATDPIDGVYNIESKFPKLDREYATSENPFKKPICMIQEGSCFYYNTKREYYGVCINNISEINKKIMMNACTIALPIRLDENSNF